MLVVPALDLYMSLRIFLIASIPVVYLYTSTAQDSLYRYDLPELIYFLAHGARFHYQESLLVGLSGETVYRAEAHESMSSQCDPGM